MSAQKQFDKNNFSFLPLKDKLICVLLVILVFFLDRISKIKIIKHQLYNDSVYIREDTKKYRLDTESFSKLTKL